MLNEKEFLEKCLDDYKNKSQHKMESLKQIEKIFDDMGKRINKLGDKKDGRNEIKKIKD